MKTYLAPLAAVCAASIAAGACRDTSRPGGNGRADAGSDAGARGALSIQEVQSDGVAPGDEVTLREVVVVAVDTYGGRKGSVYVMEPEGGEYSGVVVFLDGTQAAGLEPGDLIDIEGASKTEFSFNDDDSGRSLTQLEAAGGGEITLAKVGEGEIPAPEVVDPAVLAGDDAEAEKWASVLIQIEDVAVESPPEQISSDETFQEMRVTGPMLVVSELASLGEEPAIGDCYASVTGILTYAFDYQMLPRSEADYAPDGDSCPEGPDPVAVRDIQEQLEGDDGISEGGTVAVERAVVTAVDTNDDGDPVHLFIQDELESAEAWNGIYVYRGSDADPLPEGIEVGSLVDVVGTVAEFRNATQIGGAQVTDVGETADPVVLADPPLAEIASVADGESYEGVLVRLSNLEVTEGVNEFGEFVVSDGGTDLVVDDVIFAHEPSVGDCFATLVGVMTENNFGDGNRPLLPRSADDIVDTGGDCGAP